jgi:selenocysteine lyase/cysteine desulfurase
VLDRDLFPVSANLIYFNHAAVGPLSTRTTDAIETHARDQRDFGALHWRAWYAEDAALRRSAATLIGAQPTEIAILKNTSEGLSFVAVGFRWREGENVITTDLEFPSNYTPWKRLERRGVECRIVKSVDGAYNAEDVERLIDDKTRIVSVSSVAFHNGFAADLVAIGEVCRRRNVLFCVDAIQSVGVIPMDVRRANIAFLSADGHKWMCGPEGASIFYVAEEHRERLEVLESGWTNFDRKGKFIGCSTDLLPDSRRFEAGSLNTNGVYGLRAAIDLLLETGIDNIHAEVIRLATKLADGLESIGYPIATPRPIASGIVAARPKSSADLLRLHHALEEQKIVCAPREGLLRFSPHAWNDDAEVERVLDVLHNL